MYDMMERDYYWPHMADDVYTTAKDCVECVPNNPSEKRRRPIQLFLTSGTLEFVTMDILRPLPKTLDGNQFGWAVTNGYSKLSRAVPTISTTAAHIASMFVEHYIIL